MFLTCEQFARNLSELEDGHVSDLRRAEARFHLAWCTACRRYVAQFRAVRHHLAALKSTPTLPDRDRDRALATFRSWSPDASALPGAADAPDAPAADDDPSPSLSPDDPPA
ncbi:anti-sigma factor family protein [Chondromyces apiculatus]|uniref:Putative zinc-finger domain-containing protein n=1 Tax=Chondromyces apiculatus DSM 436 TaxID=1192034 RepID=A0A017T613_9BACT|nr:zf-HC2 domain-containing protein [Chondromyces apiculatus]EYF04462.1 Hypothetical protein CAP_4430 [Chondromyces apiculatus DSM 436]